MRRTITRPPLLMGASLFLIRGASILTRGVSVLSRGVASLILPPCARGGGKRARESSWARRCRDAQRNNWPPLQPPRAPWLTPPLLAARSPRVRRLSVQRQREQGTPAGLSRTTQALQGGLRASHLGRRAGGPGHRERRARRTTEPRATRRGRTGTPATSHQGLLAAQRLLAQAPA